MLPAGSWALLGAVLTIAHASYVPSSPGLSDAFIREMLDRMGSDLADPGRGDYLDILPQSLPLEGMAPRVMKELPAPPMALDYDGLALSPSIRDQEYLSHSSLLSTLNNNYDGKPTKQRPKPGSDQMKPNSDGGVLPAYCNPPNPCPLGYTTSNGCLEEFMNTAAFSRDYQARQDCMCDTEHMFECTDSTQDSEITALARSIQNEGVLDSALDMIMYKLGNGSHHLVAKKFHNRQLDPQNYNPYLQGEKLPIAAKKGVPL